MAQTGGHEIRWAEWGEKLMALHIGYEKVEPWPLKRIDTPDEKSRQWSQTGSSRRLVESLTGNPFGHQG
jgi:hypothetical protein